MLSVNSPLIEKRKNKRLNKFKKWLCIISLFFSIILSILLSLTCIFTIHILTNVDKNVDTLAVNINTELNSQKGNVNSIIYTLNTILSEANVQYPTINALINQVASISGNVQYMMPRILSMVNNAEPAVNTISNEVVPKISENVEPILNSYYEFSQSSLSVLNRGELLINQSLEEYPMIIGTISDLHDLIDEIRHYINSTLES